MLRHGGELGLLLSKHCSKEQFCDWQRPPRSNRLTNCPLLCVYSTTNAVCADVFPCSDAAFPVLPAGEGEGLVGPLDALLGDDHLGGDRPSDEEEESEGESEEEEDVSSDEDSPDEMEGVGVSHCSVAEGTPQVFSSQHDDMARGQAVALQISKLGRGEGRGRGRGGEGGGEGRGEGRGGGGGREGGGGGEGEGRGGEGEGRGRGGGGGGETRVHQLFTVVQSSTDSSILGL